MSGISEDIVKQIIRKNIERVLPSLYDAIAKDVMELYSVQPLSQDMDLIEEESSEFIQEVPQTEEQKLLELSDKDLRVEAKKFGINIRGKINDKRKNEIVKDIIIARSKKVEPKKVEKKEPKKKVVEKAEPKKVEKKEPKKKVEPKEFTVVHNDEFGIFVDKETGKFIIDKDSESILGTVNEDGGYESLTKGEIKDLKSKSIKIYYIDVLKRDNPLSSDEIDKIINKEEEVLEEEEDDGNDDEDPTPSGEKEKDIVDTIEDAFKKAFNILDKPELPEKKENPVVTQTDFDNFMKYKDERDLSKLSVKLSEIDSKKYSLSSEKVSDIITNFEKYRVRFGAQKTSKLAEKKKFDDESSDDSE